jgi:hypothetical protein
MRSINSLRFRTLIIEIGIRIFVWKSGNNVKFSHELIVEKNVCFRKLSDQKACQIFDYNIQAISNAFLQFWLCATGATSLTQVIYCL